MSAIVWMRHGKSLNNGLFKFHERFVRVIYNCKDSSFQNLQISVTEIITTEDSKGIAPNVLANILVSVSPVLFSPHYQSGF